MTLVIQQYGIQRVGTNATKALIERNLEGVAVDSTDKHLFPVRRARAFLVNVKDPVSWVWSVYKYRSMKMRYEKPPVHVEFNRRFVEDALVEWGSLTLSHLYLAEQVNTSLVVQHEDLLSDPENVIRRASEAYNAPLREDVELFLTGYARRGDCRTHGESLIDPKRNFDRAYHLQGRWVEDVPEWALEMSLSYQEKAFGLHPILPRNIRVDHLNPVKERLS